MALDAAYPGGRVLLIACGALAREVLALIEANGWRHLELRCLPASLHLHPDRIPDAVEPGRWLSSTKPTEHDA
jgi:hypothetical protein